MIIRYIGHPFIDVGVAVLTAHAGKTRPEDVTEDDIEAFIAEALKIYITPAMSGFLTYSVFPNTYFAYVAEVKKPETFPKRREVLNRYMHLWKLKDGEPILVEDPPAGENEVCLFSGDKAIIRAAQQLIPMIPSRDSLNFFPEGQPRIPISGWCVLALLAMPMGILASKGRGFLVHSFDYNLLQQLTQQVIDKNRQAFQIQSLEKLPNYKNAKTHLIEALVKAFRDLPNTRASITAYHFVAGGASPDIEIIHLPSMVINFINIAQKRYGRVWAEIVARAWRMEKTSKKDEEQQTDNKQIEYVEMNYFYEDLFDLPAQATTFLRRYLLRQAPKGKVDKQDPRYTYSAFREREVISWDFIGLFLEKVMQMDKERLEAIKQFGDRLARYIQDHDGRVYRKLYLARGDYEFRQELIRVANAAKEKSSETLIPYDQFLTIFFVEDNTGYGVRPDWTLAKDLLLIRIIEQLSNDWIENHRNDLPEEKEEAE
jgi:CRISPR-associated protein Cst1